MPTTTGMTTTCPARRTTDMRAVKWVVNMVGAVSASIMLVAFSAFDKLDALIQWAEDGK